MEKWIRLILWVLAFVGLSVGAGILLARLTPAHAAVTCAAPPWPPVARPVVKLLPGDVRALSEVIFGEGRGDGWCGMIGIGTVVLNRIRTNPKYFGATITQVTQKPNAFSSFGKADPNLRLMKKADESDPAFFLAQLAALAVLAGAPDPTGGAVYFHHRDMMPEWGPRTIETARIGSHIYRRDK